MALDEQEVYNIAHLSRLKIAEEQVAETAKNLSNILDLVAKMSSADTDNVAPMAHPMEVSQRLRADEVTETNQREALQENAPLVEDGFFLVPKVIE